MLDDPFQVVINDLVEKNEPLCELNHDVHNESCVPIHEPTMIIADKQPELSPGEIRRLRGLYMTVRLPRVAGCGHRYQAERQPRHRNCPFCWMTFFQNHGELVQTTDELHNTEGGVAMIIQLQGSKFLKQFRRFMSTIAHSQKEVANA